MEGLKNDPQGHISYILNTILPWNVIKFAYFDASHT